MGLALGGPCADGGPADEVGQILRHHGIQELGGGRETQVVHRQEESPSDSQAGIDIVRAVQLGVVDETLPPDRRAGLLEINPHHQKELIRNLGRQGGEFACVFHRRLGIVDRARPNHHQQARIFTAQDALHGEATLDHGFIGALVHRQRFLEFARCREASCGDDAEVVRLLHVGKSVGVEN